MSAQHIFIKQQLFWCCIIDNFIVISRDVKIDYWFISLVISVVSQCHCYCHFPDTTTVTGQERRKRQDLIEIFKMYKWLTKMDICELFTSILKFRGTRGHTLKLEKSGCTRDARKLSFSHRVTGCWNSLDQETLHAPSISAFKGRLDKLRKIRVGFFTPLSPRPHGMTDSTVKPHKVRYKVRYYL